MIRNTVTIAVLLLLSTPFFIAQESKKSKVDDAARRCVPKLVKRTQIPQDLKLRPKKGEKPSRYPPVVTYYVLESGDVANATVKRSSGVSSIDEYALKWTLGMKYNARPGCGTVESSATVLIHWK